MESLQVLNLGDDFDLFTEALWGLLEQVTHSFNIIGRSHEGDGNHINAILDSKLIDIKLILVSQDWDVEMCIWQVHGLLLSENVVVPDFDHHSVLSNLSHLTLEPSIIDKDLRAELHSLGQLTVIGRDTSGITLNGRVNNDLELLSLFELDGLTLLERASQDRWSLSVKHDGKFLLLSL